MRYVTPKKITDQIYQVGGSLISELRDCASYLLDFGELLLIDSGAGVGFDEMVKNIEFLGYDPSKIGTVLLTHCHADHAGGAHLFRSQLGCKLVMHDLDAEIAERGDIRLTAAFCFEVDFKPLPIDIKLKGDEGHIHCGDQKLFWVHTPGHTPGSISVYFDRNGMRTLFAQDIGAPLLKEFDCDPEAWVRSMDRLFGINADMLCDGHSGAYHPKQHVFEYLQYCIDNQRQMGYLD